MDPSFVELLRCPITHQKLHVACSEDCHRIQHLQHKNELYFTNDEPVRYTISDVLIRDDHQIAFPVREGIPVLLRQEALKWPQ